MTDIWTSYNYAVYKWLTTNIVITYTSQPALNKNVDVIVFSQDYLLISYGLLKATAIIACVPSKLQIYPTNSGILSVVQTAEVTIISMKFTRCLATCPLLL